MCNAILFDKVLIEISNISQALIISCVVMFPMLNISGLLLCFYIVKSIETKDKKNASEKLHSILMKIDQYKKCAKHDNIIWKLNEFSKDIGDVANILYKENEPAHNK